MATCAYKQTYGYYHTFLSQCSVFKDNTNVLVIQLMIEISLLMNIIVCNPHDIDGIRFQAAQSMRALGMAIDSLDPDLELISLDAKKDSENTCSIQTGHKLMKTMADLLTTYLRSIQCARDRVFVLGAWGGNFFTFKFNVSKIATHLWELSGLTKFTDLLDFSMILYYHPSLLSDRQLELSRRPYKAHLYRLKSINVPTISLHPSSPLWTLITRDENVKWLELKNCTPEQMVHGITVLVRDYCETKDTDGEFVLLKDLATMLGITFTPGILENKKALLGPILAHSVVKTFSELWADMYEKESKDFASLSGEANVGSKGEDANDKPGHGGASADLDQDH